MPSRPKHLISVTVLCGRLCGQTFVLSLCCRFVSRLFLCQTFVCFIIMSFYVVVLYPDLTLWDLCFIFMLWLCSFVRQCLFYLCCGFVSRLFLCFIFVVVLCPDCSFVLSLLWFCIQIVPLFYLCCGFVSRLFLCFIFVVVLCPECSFVLSLLWFCVQIVPLSGLSLFYLCCNFVRPFFVVTL
jgi:hypothetical protein